MFTISDPDSVDRHEISYRVIAISYHPLHFLQDFSYCCPRRRKAAASNNSSAVLHVANSSFSWFSRAETIIRALQSRGHLGYFSHNSTPLIAPHRVPFPTPKRILFSVLRFSLLFSSGYRLIEIRRVRNASIPPITNARIGISKSRFSKTALVIVDDFVMIALFC